MNTSSAPLPTPDDLAPERLVAAVESSIVGIQERLPDLAADGHDARNGWCPTVTRQRREQLEQDASIFAATHDICPLGRRPARPTATH